MYACWTNVKVQLVVEAKEPEKMLYRVKPQYTVSCSNSCSTENTILIKNTTQYCIQNVNKI